MRETCRIVVGTGLRVVWAGSSASGGSWIDAWAGSRRDRPSVGINPNPRVSLGEVLRVARRRHVGDRVGAGAGLRMEALSKGCHLSICLPFAVDEKVVAAHHLCRGPLLRSS